MLRQSRKRVRVVRGTACVAEGDRALVLLPDGAVGVVLDDAGEARAWPVDARGTVDLEGPGTPLHACRPFFEGMPVRYRGAGPAVAAEALATSAEEPATSAEERVTSAEERATDAEERAATAEARATTTAAENAALLEELDAARSRIEELEAEVERLARERIAAGKAAKPGAAPQGRLFERVGLHPECPDHLLEAAQRSFRRHLHPDRHPPEQRASADAEFRAMEATFHEIRELRRGRVRTG